MNEVDQALSLFQEGYSCSQAILISYAQQFNLKPEIAARLAAPFGGGVARRGETCGAVSGGIMVVGLKMGHSSAEDKDSKERTYRMVEEFISHFKSVMERSDAMNCSIGISALLKVYNRRVRLSFSLPAARNLYPMRQRSLPS